ncbi:MAG TPA: tetratricopeptide repeat protein [Candidatus Acidoferrales bacterium]|jgi:serine/threonine-protein kinase|nr:tetratricopeptide repeat protein [Candidatus Acidoferrales bacterium]
MTPEVWQRVKEALAGALEREPEDRPAYLDHACAEELVRREVDLLLASIEREDSSFLEQSAIDGCALDRGALLGSYEILAHLGSGGMGDVYRARDTRLNREVAIKVLSQTFANDPNLLMRFRREAHVLASLNHPNIVTIYDIGQDGRTVYIAMELIEGKALDEILAAGAMVTHDALDVAIQIGAGLAVAHECGIVHRDLKPKNVMIRKDGLAKILDFGLSKLAPDFPRSPLDGASAVTEQGILLGTTDYMSPEQASGLSTDFHSDQFSFGSLLYEMVAGKQPFHRETIPQTLAAIIEVEPTPIASLNPKVPAAIERIVHRCLAKNPEGRYASTQELARELKEIRDFSAAELTTSLSASARTVGRRTPLWLEIALAGALVVAGIGIAVPRFFERARDWSASISPVTLKQVVVLPFTNVGNDPENQSFCDGLVEILSSKLSQLEQFQQKLRVVPSTDVLREGIVSVREARQTFGATLAITGSVQRAENRVRLTINLVDPQTLLQLKSKTIDTEARDISVLQDGVVLAVAELLDVKLSSQAKQVLAVGGTTVPGAYEYYMQGKGYLQRYEVTQNVDTAISLFNLALGQDRSYALAEAGLGEAYWRKYELTKDTQWADQAKKSIADAIGLNDKLAQVYVTLGMIHTGTGQFDEAVQSLQKALALDPINSDAYRELAKTYQGMERPKDAESTYLNAIAVRPSDWAAYNELGGFYYHLGRYAEAENEFRHVVELTPDNARGYSNLGVIAYSQKRYGEAAKMFEKSAAIKPTDFAYSNLGTIYYTLSQYDEAAQYYEKAIQMNGRDIRSWHNLAAAYQWSSDPEKARAAFQRTAELAEEQRRVNPRDPTLLIFLADAYSYLNQPLRARELLRQGLVLAPDDVPNMFQASAIYERLGDRKLALQWIGMAIKGGFSLDLIEKEPTLAQLRLDPRFQDFLRP